MREADQTLECLPDAACDTRQVFARMCACDVTPASGAVKGSWRYRWIGGVSMKYMHVCIVS